MLVLSRNDGEQFLFMSGERARLVTVKIDEDSVRWYRKAGQRDVLVGVLEYAQDSTVINVTGFDVGVTLVKYRACDSATLGFEADRDDVQIRRAELL